jgi:hypothetical protein
MVKIYDIDEHQAIRGPGRYVTCPLEDGRDSHFRKLKWSINHHVYGFKAFERYTCCCTNFVGWLSQLGVDQLHCDFMCVQLKKVQRGGEPAMNWVVPPWVLRRAGD